MNRERERNSQRKNILSSASYKIRNTNDIYAHPKLPFNKATDSKNEIQFIHKPFKTQEPFLVILIYVLPEDSAFGLKKCLKEISHVHYKQLLVAIDTSVSLPFY